MFELLSNLVGGVMKPKNPSSGPVQNIDSASSHMQALLDDHQTRLALLETVMKEKSFTF